MNKNQLSLICGLLTTILTLQSMEPEVFEFHTHSQPTIDRLTVNDENMHKMLLQFLKPQMAPIEIKKLREELAVPGKKIFIFISKDGITGAYSGNVRAKQ